MAQRTPIESGVPDNKQYMHPTLLKNYGNWKYHDRPRPGVLHHVAHSGDEIWTVRAGTQRQMDVYTIRKLCDIADTYADGHVRFTIRSNIEFMVADENKVAPLIEALSSNGFPVGGTGNSVSMVSHTQGWLHCDIPGTDASGVVKALMDELYGEFVNKEMPNRVKLSTSCCEINCGGQADIAIIVQHTKPPKINHALVANACERPAVVKKILYTYKEDARSWERVSDWIERIGWPRFFEKCDLPFTKYLIDDWRGSRASLNASTHIRF